VRLLPCRNQQEAQRTNAPFAVPIVYPAAELVVTGHPLPCHRASREARKATRFASGGSRSSELLAAMKGMHVLITVTVRGRFPNAKCNIVGSKILTGTGLSGQLEAQIRNLNAESYVAYGRVAKNILPG